MMGVKSKLTVEEFFKAYPEERRLELIDGEVYEMPAPSFVHQEVLFRLAISIRAYIRSKGSGISVIAPIDVVLSEDTVLQPDIVYLSELSKVKDKIYGVPDLVVEVVSPSTLKRDLVDKMKIYEAHGVREYWLVFPSEKTLMVYALKGTSYELFSYATEEGKVSSKVLEGFEIDLKEIFGGL
ncbi:MAG: Uma2 family endonuclease [Aquificaceae bacterium]|nr:Uma2 family endonuclease [Aquificaceae bacterium]